jgi:hypothetical protein
MKAVKFLGVTIVIDGIVYVTQYDLGSVTLECQGRTYMLDIVKSSSEFINGETVIECKLAEDRETLTDSKYDLLPEDFFNKDLKGTVFIGNDYETDPESQTLFVKFESAEGGMTKAIDLELE